VRIERLWVDVTAQVGSTWADIFVQLELHHGLEVNNRNHIWLLHHLFLPRINEQLTFFAESWNHHRIQIRRGPNRSPIDMFVFDMLVHGVRGDQINQEPTNEMSEEELEVFGIDWEGLADDTILESRHANNGIGEGWSSWVGRVGPPTDLNEVRLESPHAPLHPEQIVALDRALSQWTNSQSMEDIASTWFHALSIARVTCPDLF
jgi:hypothetical protein